MIFVILVIVATLAIIAGGILIDLQVKQHLTANLIGDYASQEHTIGDEVSQSLNLRIQNIENSLTAVSLDPSIQSSNPAICNPALQNYYTNLNLGIGNLGRVNTNGVFYCVVNKALLNKSAFALGPYLHTLFSDPKHQPVLSRQIKVPNVSGYITALHVPVFSPTHQFLGSIGGAIYQKQLASSYLSKIKFASTGWVSLQDDNGDILYGHSPKNIGKNYFSPAIQNQTGNLTELNRGILAAHNGKTSTVVYTLKGVKKIAAVTPVDVTAGHRWVVIVSVPESEIAATIIHSGINNAFNIIFIVFGVALVFASTLLIITGYTSYKLQLAKDQFVSLVSHQLRTPLTSIRLFGEMLLDPEVGPLNAKQKDYAQKIHLSCVRMISLVGDILNVSRIELGRLKIELKKTDLEELIASKVDEIQPLADERGVKLIVNMPKTKVNLKLDQTLFGQVIHNLLTNSIRYSPEKTGEIEISLKKQRSAWLVMVKDNGIGIPVKDRKKVFKRFYRSENAVKTVGDGTGLGLYLVRMIMLATGGDVWFDSVINQGTTFYVKIPLKGMIPKKGMNKI